ncbi:alpha/beta hydrolase [Allorhizocola rhizosphaerae]|uniref:alpha/beta hydrolase n=1 Tax=Allorhizocola rhizosphaerae TaxID=1872709 RepID=UPI001FE87520|nr:alpha/beta fold hydrolase [Allorhizocola rhizosphaerae]
MNTLLVVVLVLAGVLALLWLGQRQLIYFPSTGFVPRDVELRTSDGLTLGATLVRPPPSGPDRRLAVLVANGNGGDRTGRMPLAHDLAGRGFTVLLFDYRGYGGNPGSPSEAGLYRDIRAAYAHLTTLFPAERIILFGESLGGALVTDLAAQSPVGGVVLRSPFTDLAAVGGRHYPFLPVRLLLRDKYPLIETISRVPAPVIVILGSADSIVPPSLSREVAARVPRLVGLVEVQGADHNDPELFDGPQIIDAVDRLAAEI